MAEKELAKVDYVKPLNDKPYAEVCAEKETYSAELKKRLGDIVGSDNVVDDAQALQKYGADPVMGVGGLPACAVFPDDAEQVCTLVGYANEEKIPLAPASSGTHDYSAASARMGGVVVDLSGWKKIFKIDRRNRAVRIQPGVTYDQLQDALEKENLRAMIPLQPRKDQSVLTAHLEAHPMLVTEFNYTEPIYTAEIVMPSGTIFRTGTASLAPPEAVQSDMIGPWGPGFDWNRLYTRSQGTLGIVTWINIMAEPLPKKQKIYFTASDDIARLVDFTYRVQRRWIGYECFILGRSALAFLLASSGQEYESLQQNLPAYVQVFCIGGIGRFPEERIDYQEKDFLAVSQDCGVSPLRTVPEAPKAASFFERAMRRSWGGDVYWKDMRKGAHADIFFVTTMDRAPAFIAAMQEQAVRDNYNAQDIGVYLQPIENGRVAHLEFVLPCNPHDERQRETASRLFDNASRRMYELGGIFTRAYGTWGIMTSGRNAVQHKTARMIKDTIDPHNIMNPGKLGL